jgi:NTP pyrophosphatase (non-canonical NTP hydrolase)
MLLHEESTAYALDLVRTERANQDQRWGEQNHAPLYWLGILMEEVGEVAKALIEFKMGEYRKEVVQVGAVAVAMLEAYDRSREVPDAVLP